MSDSLCSSEIDVVENYFQDTLENTVKRMRKDRLEICKWLEFTEALADFQSSWVPPVVRPDACNAVILQSMVACEELTRDMQGGIDHGELFRRLVFLPYDHVSVISPFEAAIYFRSMTKVLANNERHGGNASYDPTGEFLRYAEFLQLLRPFVNAGYATIVAPRSNGRRNWDGYWVDPDLLQQAETELHTAEHPVRELMREMLLSIGSKVVDSKNVDSMMHWARPCLAKTYDDLLWANRINAHYVIPHEYIHRLIRQREDHWESIPKTWRHSPLFRTTIPCEVALPDLASFPTRDMLALRRDGENWARWRSSVERVLRGTHELASEGGTVRERLIQAHREELEEASLNLRREIQKQSLPSLTRSAMWTFTLHMVGTLISGAGFSGLEASGTGTLLEMLTRVLFRRSSGSRVLYNHYSMLSPGSPNVQPAP